MSEDNIDPMAEAKAMQGLAALVKELEPEAIRRVLRWANAVYGVTVSAPAPRPGASGGTGEVGGNNGGGSGTSLQFTDLGDLFAATSPTTDADKALVAGYWFQFVEGQPDISAQAINTALKNLGEGVGNITTAFNNLKARKPAPVIQLKKSGTSKQARKTYKLTAAGKNAVELMVGKSA